MKAAFESSMIHDVLGDDVDPGDAADADYDDDDDDDVDDDGDGDDDDDDDDSPLSSSAASSWCCRPSWTFWLLLPIIDWPKVETW